MIYCLVGRPGTGKTYSLVHLAWKQICYGRDVYANFFIDFTTLKQRRNARILFFYKIVSKIGFRKQFFWLYTKLTTYGQVKFWKKLSDFTGLQKGIILMDEAQIYINAREYKSLDTSVQYKFQQHRKHGLDLYLAVQNVKRIDVVARELVNAVFEFKRIGKLFFMQEFDIEEIDKAKRTPYKLKFFFFSKAIAKCYNTMQEIVR